MTTTALRWAFGPLLFALALPAQAEEPFVDLPIEDAKARAEKEDRILVLHFHSNEDAAARRMVTQTFGDPQVRDWIRDQALAVMIDAEDLDALRRYGVASFPTTLFFGADNKLLHKMEYARSATEFLIAAHSVKLSLGDITRPDGDQAENPMAWLAWGNWLFNNSPDRAEEALDAYLWCLDRGESNLAGFRPMHLEFLLERVAYLKPRTQRAVQALWDRRGILRNQILGGDATDDVIREYLRFNFWLRDELDALNVFDELKGIEGRPLELRTKLMRAQLPLLCAWKRYEDILELEPAIHDHIDTRLKAWDEKTKSEDVTPDPAERSEIVDDASYYFEVLVATGRAGDGLALLDHVVEAVPTGRAYRLFMERTNRLEFYKLTHKIAKKGLEVVKGKGRRLIEAELRRAPAEGEEKVKPVAPDLPPRKKGDGGGDQR